MSFKINPKNTRDVRAVKRSSAIATTEGYLYQLNTSTGAAELAGITTTATQVLFRANETTSSSTNDFSGTFVSKEDTVIVDTVNNSNSAHNGQRMLIDATGSKLNNTGTDSTTGVFEQVEIVGATTDKKVLARKI